MITKYLQWMKSSSSWPASLRSSVLSPGLPSRRLQAWDPPTAAWGETVVLTSTTRPRALAGSVLATVINRSRRYPEETLESLPKRQEKPASKGGSRNDQ
jgi:hypothetical protein